MTRAFIPARFAAGISSASLWLVLGAPAPAQEIRAPVAVSAGLASHDAVMAIVLGTQPVDPSRLALGRRLTLAIREDRAMAGATPVIFATIRRQILDGISPNASTTLRAAFTAAVDETLASGLEADLQAKLTARLARYHAVSLDETLLRDAVEFYESPLGRKAVVGDSGWSEADRKAIVEYALVHAEVVMTGVSHDPQNALDAIMNQEAQALLPTLQQRLCANLKQRHVVLSSCAK
jgi:hypothetical protein